MILGSIHTLYTNILTPVCIGGGGQKGRVAIGLSEAALVGPYNNAAALFFDFRFFLLYIVRTPTGDYSFSNTFGKASLQTVTVA